MTPDPLSPNEELEVLEERRPQASLWTWHSKVLETTGPCAVREGIDRFEKATGERVARLPYLRFLRGFAVNR